MIPSRIEPAGGALRAVVLLLCGAGVFAGLWGCDTPSAPSLPPPPPPPAPRIRLEGDYRTSARCGPATVTVEGPRRLELRYGGYLQRLYSVVDVSVESPLSEAMILDFREWYDVTDWRVRSDGDRVRHEFRVYWDPRNLGRITKASPPGVWPMTILACPEADGGPVLACSHSSCEVYESEDAVPQVVPWYTRVLFRSPWGYGEVRELQEGRTLDIPLSYVVYRDTEKIQFIVAVRKLGPWEDPSQDLELLRHFEVGPFSSGESGTVEFRVKAIADGLEEAEGGELFSLTFLGADATGPNTIALRILDPP